MKEILLLHGATGDREQMKPPEELLTGDLIVHLLNFNGHGGKPFSIAPFSIAGFADEVLDHLYAHDIKSITVFGYSMGGYVAMYLARHYPRKIDKVITLATKFKWDEIIAAKETAMLNAGKIEVKIPAFAGTLKKRHYPNDWKIVLHKTAEMLTAMGQKNPLQTEDLKKIEHPVLIMLGDKDKMVSREETMEVYHQLANAQLSILTDTPHPIESVNIERLAFEIKAFLK